MSAYLVTGGAGFIGSYLVEALLREDHRVRVMDCFVRGRVRARLHDGAEVIEGSITDAEVVQRACAGVDGVFHLAAIPNVQQSLDDPHTTYPVNLGGTINVLEAACAARVCRVVFASSAAVYGDQAVLPLHEDMQPRPKSHYAIQKLASEYSCRMYSETMGLETVCLRYANVYGLGQADDGPYANLFPIFLRQRARGEPLTITGDGEQTRDYVHVTDVVRASVCGMVRPNVGHGEVMNVSANADRSVNDIARLFGGAVQHLPPRIEPRAMRLDNTRAATMLDWKPEVRLEDGIRELLELYGLAASAPPRATT